MTWIKSSEAVKDIQPHRQESKKQSVVYTIVSECNGRGYIKR